MTKKKQTTKAKRIDPRDAIISDPQAKLAVLGEQFRVRCAIAHELQHKIDSVEKAACGTPRPYLSPGLVVNEPALVVDNNGRSWWINPGTLEIRAA